MSGFENHAETVAQLEREIIRRGLVLGIDWNDEVQVNALAREAMEHGRDDVRRVETGEHDPRLMAKVDLFGLAALMLRTLQESADEGIERHGGPVWKAFGRALWAACPCEQRPRPGGVAAAGPAQSAGTSGIRDATRGD